MHQVRHVLEAGAHEFEKLRFEGVDGEAVGLLGVDLLEIVTHVGEVLVAAVELHHFVLVSLLPILLQLADCLGLLIVKQGRAKQLQLMVENGTTVLCQNSLLEFQLQRDV